MRVGTSFLQEIRSPSNQDHPHACGDKRETKRVGLLKRGSSPCVWGQGVSHAVKALDARIIPMRVGTRKADIKKAVACEDHPHACGDKAQSRLITFMNRGSSPCVWGQGENTANTVSGCRIIPMRVGTRGYSWH